MSEQIFLDPSEVATGRTTVDITPWLDDEGINWGDATIQTYMAEQRRGEVPVDYRVPNREVSGGLKFTKTVSGTTTSAARTAIQAKLSLFQREGGWIKRITNAGGTVFADVVDAQFRATSVQGWQSADNIDLDASFVLSCIPDFYEGEVTLSDHTETSAAELIFTEATVYGDYPGRVRIVVDEDDGDSQRGLIWAWRSRHYSSSANAAMEYEAEELGVLDTAAKAALSGASGGTVVTHGTLSTSWTPVMTGRIGGTTYPTHTGSYQMLARLYSTSGTLVRARGVWDVGDLVNPTENPPYRLPGASNFYIADLGEVRLDPAPVGTHRWDYQIQGAGDAGAENLSVDKVWLVNKDEGMGMLSAPITFVEGLATYSARSEFATESGAITGDSLAVGGAWTAVTNSDASDGSVAAGVYTRTDVSDTGTLYLLGRAITASTTAYTTLAAQVDFKASAFDTTSVIRQGLYLRGTAAGADSVIVYFAVNATSGLGFISFQMVTSSANAGFVSTPSFAVATNTYYTMRVVITASGQLGVWFGPQGSSLPLVISGSNSLLATGGTLASGRVGIFDGNASATASTRTYDNFAAWVPADDAVTFASQSLQLTTDGMYREDSGGTAYGPVSKVIGDIPRIPPTVDGRTTQLFIKPTRGDLDQLPDAGLDDVSAQIFYRPSWLFVDDT